MDVLLLKTTFALTIPVSIGGIKSLPVKGISLKLITNNITRGITARGLIFFL